MFPANLVQATFQQVRKALRHISKNININKRYVKNTNKPDILEQRSKQHTSILSLE